MNILSQILAEETARFFLKNWSMETMTAIIVFVLTYAFLRYKHKKELKELSYSIELVHSQIREIKALILEFVEEENQKKLLLKIEEILNKKSKKRK